MNILFVSSAKAWGGGEVWLEQVCTSLSRRGHSVVVVCQPRSRLLDQLLSSNIRAVPMKISGDFNPYTIAEIYRVVKSFEIDIICTNTEKELRLSGIAAVVAGVPIVVSREVDFPIKNSSINRFFYTRIASGMMMNSHSTYNTMLVSAPWLNDQDIEIIWKGIRIEDSVCSNAADLRSEFQLNPEDCVIGFLGRLDEQKGIPTLLDAMKKAVRQQPQLKLVLAGRGNLASAIHDFSVNHHLERHIFLSGFRIDAAAFLKGIDFLVMPSYWEGFGYSAVEAMAAGKAVIGTYSSSLAEIVESGRTGLLVPPRSVCDLSDAILRLGNDRDLRESMGRAGYARAKRYFQIDGMVTKTESFFDNIIKSRRRSQPKVAYVSISEQSEIPFSAIHK